MIYTIFNDFLKVQINSTGAELYSIKNNENTEYIWQGDPEFWPRRAPVLFPLPGRCVDDITYFDRKEYKMPLHGFLKDRESKVTEKTDNSVTFTFTSDDDTLKMYPFEFTVAINFTLENNTLTENVKITNKSQKEMPFAFGGHMGFNCPLESNEKFSDYSITFHRKEKETNSILKGDELLKIHKEDDFTLDHELFRKGPRIFETVSSDSLSLTSKNTGKGVKVEYTGFCLVALWTCLQKDAPFLCIEPWSGMSNKYTKTPVEFSKHTAMNFLSPDKFAERSIKMTIL